MLLNNSIDEINGMQELLNNNENNTQYLLPEQDDIFYREDYEYEKGQKIMNNN